jgi:hypothetical protein
MNCSTHTDVPAVAFCRTCGKALCADCRRVAQGTVFCDEHAPAPTTSPYSASAGSVPPSQPVDTHPGLAFVLGFIPGVGAIYNGQYAKGLVHAIIFGLLVSILSANAAEGLEPLIGIMLAAFVIYMPFEAYHTAKRRNQGERVDEFSSLIQPRPHHSSAGAVTLIIVGCVFLLNTLGIFPLHHILRFWPVLLIALGINMLHSRLSDAGAGAPPQNTMDQNREVNHERQ